MEIHMKAEAGFTTVVVNGRLDALSASAAEASLNSAIDAGASRLMVNLAGLEYVSSAGLRILLATLKKVTRLNGKIVLCGLRPVVREVFEISGLLSIFQVAENETAAQALVVG